MNEIIDQNNYQYRINESINKRIAQLTGTINQMANVINNNKANLEVLDAITIMLNVDVINELLDNIQEAVTLSKISVTLNKMLSTRDVNVIKSTLHEQGIEVNFPDEALQFVTPKIAVKQGDLLYILHVPHLENSTSTVIRIFPLIVDNQIIKSYPSHIIRHGHRLFTTANPRDFVQRSSNIKEFEDECIQNIILGKRSKCNSIFKDETTQQLANENTVIISNAKNHTLSTNCGPEDRNITGNFIVIIRNCTVHFNNQSFTSTEMTVDTELIHGAFHNSFIEWNLHKQHDIATINKTAVSNRQQPNHVYLRQDSLHFKLWTTFGGFSFSTILGFVIVGVLIKIIYKNRTNGTGRSSLRGGLVTEVTEQHEVTPGNHNEEERILQQQVAKLQHQQSELQRIIQQLEEQQSTTA